MRDGNERSGEIPQMTEDEKLEVNEEKKKEKDNVATSQIGNEHPTENIFKDLNLDENSLREHLGFKRIVSIPKLTLILIQKTTRVYFISI